MPAETKKSALNGVYRLWISGRLIPQTPGKITYEYEDKTETIRLANEQNFTIPRNDGPIKISFDFDCTSKDYPFTWDVDYERKRWSDFLWQIKQDRRPVSFDMRRTGKGSFDVSLRVLVTDWHFVEDAERDNDFTISVTLMEYFPQENQEVNSTVQHHLIQNRRVRGWTERGRGFVG